MYLHLPILTFFALNLFNLTDSIFFNFLQITLIVFQYVTAY